MTPSGNLIVTELVIVDPGSHTSLKGFPTSGLNSSAYNLLPSKIHLVLYKQNCLVVSTEKFEVFSRKITIFS